MSHNGHPDVNKKIKTPSALAKIVHDLKQKGKTVVQCHGVFDLLHLGHIRHFTAAKKEGDVLIVTLTRDKYVKRGPGRPVFNEQLRAETLANLAVTDFISIVDSPTATDFIKQVKPDIYAKGIDYKQKDKDVTGMIYEEEDAIQQVGGRIVFTDDITFSSSSLLNNYLDTFSPRTVRYLKAIAKRYPIDTILDSIKGLKKLKVLVIGDAIVDEYRYCHPMGKSSKEHLVVNRYDSEELFAGGSLATANNVASVCGEVDLITVLGERHSNEDFIRSKLSSNINPIFFYRTDVETIIKRRYVNKETNRKLFEICYLQDNDIPRDVEAEIMEQLAKTLRQYDLVIVSDFG
ncbi:MAG: hypothetical protein A2Z88_10650, partial [Omnitrophica WOR_2 bacterium GWA2_47_8]